MYSGGGLLVNTIAIFASISSDTVAKEDLRDFRSELNQIVWDMDCSWQEFYIHDDIHATEDTKENAWILEPKYEDSRTKVIGKAIADCVTGENEFKDKNAADIITFEGTKPETYKQKHWNAVILYNYIHEMINGGKDGNEVVKVLGHKLAELKAYYGTQYDKKIDDAVKVIQSYADALDLGGGLLAFRIRKLEYDKDNNIQYIAFNVNTYKSDNEKLKFNYFFIKFDEKYQNKGWLYSPTFRYRDGKLYISGLKMHDKGTPYKVLDLDVFLKNCGWLLELLKGLVEQPTEELWDEWYPKKNKKKNEALEV